jgi:hypothetical protein
MMLPDGTPCLLNRTIWGTVKGAGRLARLAQPLEIARTKTTKQKKGVPAKELHFPHLLGRQLGLYFLIILNLIM